MTTSREVKKTGIGKLDFSIDALVGGSKSTKEDICPSASSTPSPTLKLSSTDRNRAPVGGGGGGGGGSGNGTGSAFSQPTTSSSAGHPSASVLWTPPSAVTGAGTLDYVSLVAQQMGLLKNVSGGLHHPVTMPVGLGSHQQAANNASSVVGNFYAELNKAQQQANPLWQLQPYLQEALQKSVVLAGPPYSRFFNSPDIGHHGYHPYRKPKRIRTAFNPHQLLRLEQSFDRNHYVVGTERKDLAKSLCLSETQVKVWFQNRRTKFKRQKNEDDSKKPSNDSSSNNKSASGRSKTDRTMDKEGSTVVSSSSSRGSNGIGQQQLIILQDGSNRSINIEEDEEDDQDDDQMLMEDGDDDILDNESLGNVSN